MLRFGKKHFPQDLLTSNSGVGINVSIKYIGVIYTNFYVKTGLNFLQGSSQKERYRYFIEIVVRRDHK